MRESRERVKPPTHLEEIWMYFVACPLGGLLAGLVFRIQNYSDFVCPLPAPVQYSEMAEKHPDMKVTHRYHANPDLLAQPQRRSDMSSQQLDQQQEKEATIVTIGVQEQAPNPGPHYAPASGSTQGRMHIYFQIKGFENTTRT